LDTTTAILAFSAAAALLTLTPGLDTALVLRTAAVEGGRRAMLAGCGISVGAVLWGAVAGLGLGALLAVSATAYLVLKVAGALYLLYLGTGMLRSALRGGTPPAGCEARGGARRRPAWFLRGLTTNLLNPKVGVFYVSFLPQFIPAGANVAAFSVMLAAIHAAMGLAWFGLLVLATRPLARVLRDPRVTRALDGVTGAVLVLFGLRLALARQPG
jgi:threonine/homoserine/homoserine lactone efflux protein